MFIAMNTFTVNEERIQEFEEVWSKRDRFLKEMDGFISFKLLKGEIKEGKREYISHSTWNSSEEFWSWTKSEQFKMAHKNRTPEGIILGPPRFGFYDVILEE
ncbi:MAG: antibiotic biosynthesis monooxygenase [Halobacteriovoraceae bacterium]|nr:antibiotic biosynthesis monooxygenase [Halobacteriovoraceae bacterium]